MRVAVWRACAFAGAGAGLVLGLWQAVQRLLRPPSPPASRASQPKSPAPRPLLNLVVLSQDSSELSAAVALAMAGREPSAAAPADLLFVATPAAACSLWAPPSEQLPALGPPFFGLADAGLLVYEPRPVLAGQASACQLEHLAGMCRQGRPGSSTPLVAAAVLPSTCSEGSAARRAVQEGELWCASRGIKHCVLAGLQDRPGIQAAFEALLAAALGRHGPAPGQASATAEAGHPTGQESVPVTPRGPAPPELPLMMQSELGPALRQLTPRRSAVENAAM